MPIFVDGVKSVSHIVRAMQSTGVVVAVVAVVAVGAPWEWDDGGGAFL